MRRRVQFADLFSRRTLLLGAAIGALAAAMRPVLANEPLPRSPQTHRKRPRRPLVPYRSEPREILYWTNRSVAVTAEGKRVYGSGRGEVSTGCARTTTKWDTRYSTPDVTIESVRTLGSQALLGRLSAALAASTSKSVVIYIPGHWNAFEDVIATASLLRTRLTCDGPTVAISYPSSGGFFSLFSYFQTANDLEWTIQSRHLQRFIASVLALDDLVSVHLIAHSMGARALAEVLSRLDHSSQAHLLTKIKTVSLAAPDIDIDIFDELMLPVIRRVGFKTTIYVNDDDLAMRLSSRWPFNGRPRVGSTDAGLYLRDGVDTIDATEVDTSFAGHSGFVQSRIGTDMFYAVCRGLEPQARQLERATRGSRTYWKMRQ